MPWGLEDDQVFGRPVGVVGVLGVAQSGGATDTDAAMESVVRALYGHPTVAGIEDPTRIVPWCWEIGLRLRALTDPLFAFGLVPRPWEETRIGEVDYAAVTLPVVQEWAQAVHQMGDDPSESLQLVNVLGALAVGLLPYLTTPVATPTGAERTALFGILLALVNAVGGRAWLTTGAP